MITFQTETLFDVIDEVQPLLELHYQELTLNRDRVKLDPDWPKYVALEQAGAFVVYTARDEQKKLVGYSAFLINQHLHYVALKAAYNDVLFVLKEHRQGTTGIKLIRYSERELKALGVDKLTWHVKFSRDLRPILHRLGYADEEVVCAKMLND